MTHVLNGLTKKDSLALKGIAILFMLFHHLYCSLDRFENYTVDFSPFSQDTVVSVALFFKICVSIFAFITGYGLLRSIAKTPLNRKSVFKWNITRLIKTMSGFWLIYVLSFIVSMIIDARPLEVYFGGSRAKGVLYVLLDFLGLANFFDTPTLCGTWWYMSAAIVFILIIPLIYMVSRKVGYLPVILVIVALPRLLNVGYPGGVNAYSFILPVVFGMLFAEYKVFERISGKLPKNKFASWAVSFVVFGVLCVASFILFRVYPQHEGWEFNYGIVPVIVICFARYCLIRIPALKQVFAFLGKHSMTIFLTHTFIRGIYLSDFIYSFKNFMLIYVVLFVLSVVLAVIIDVLTDLVKYHQLIAKLNQKISAYIDKAKV